MALPRRLSAIALALCAKHAAIAAPPVDRRPGLAKTKLPFSLMKLYFARPK
jgi:hypothetical protein